MNVAPKLLMGRAGSQLKLQAVPTYRGQYAL